MIHILHMLGSLNVGGSQAMLLNIYRNIDRKEFRFDIIIDHEDQTFLASEFEKLGSKIYVMPRFYGSNIRDVQKAWNRFFQEHSEYKILHSHVRSYASVYIPIAKKYGVKTIVHSHSTSNGKGVIAAVKRVMQYPLRYQADYLMACSSEAGRWLFGERACKKSNYFFLPNAIDMQKYSFSEATAGAYKKEFGLENRFVVGHVGRFHEAKNHIFLLEVFAKVCAQRSDAMLLLIGDGELREQILSKIKELQIEEHVILAGSRNDVPQLMCAMDVFVFPSAWEGLPVVVVEAQAVGLPCFISDTVTTDVAISELVTQLPLQSSELWAKMIIDANIEKKCVIEKIQAAGFDVRNTAKLLGNFYISLGG